MVFKRDELEQILDDHRRFQYSEPEEYETESEGLEELEESEEYETDEETEEYDPNPGSDL